MIPGNTRRRTRLPVSNPRAPDSSPETAAAEAAAGPGNDGNHKGNDEARSILLALRGQGTEVKGCGTLACSGSLFDVMRGAQTAKLDLWPHCSDAQQIGGLDMIFRYCFHVVAALWQSCKVQQAMSAHKVRIGPTVAMASLLRIWDPRKESNFGLRALSKLVSSRSPEPTLIVMRSLNLLRIPSRPR